MKFLTYFTPRIQTTSSLLNCITSLPLISSSYTMIFFHFPSLPSVRCAWYFCFLHSFLYIQVLTSHCILHSHSLPTSSWQYLATCIMSLYLESKSWQLLPLISFFLTLQFHLCTESSSLWAYPGTSTLSMNFSPLHACYHILSISVLFFFLAG